MNVSIDDATFKHVLPDACLEQETEHNLAYVRLAAKSQNPMSKFATASRKLRNQAERIIPLSGVTVSIAGSEVPVMDEESAALLRVRRMPTPDHQGAGCGEGGEDGIEGEDTSPADAAGCGPRGRRTSRLKWTASETVRLRELAEEHAGFGRWARIAQGLPGRTENEAQCRWRRMLTPDPRSKGMSILE